jgi:hypothetical protein
MSKEVLCPHCLGGKYVVEDGPGIQAVKCYLCKGTGNVDETEAQIYLDKLSKNVHDYLNDE